MQPTRGTGPGRLMPTVRALALRVSVLCGLLAATLALAVMAWSAAGVLARPPDGVAFETPAAGDDALNSWSILSSPAPQPPVSPAPSPGASVASGPSAAPSSPASADAAFRREILIDAGDPMRVVVPLPSEEPIPTATPTPPGPPSETLRLRLVKVISGSISPKSIVSSQTGRFFAQNMMYRHTITVYDRSFRLVKTIPDSINLSRFGYTQYPRTVRGAPVEAAFSPDGSTAYVSQYSMYGYGFAHPGWDVCLPRNVIDRSFVYRIDVATLRITGVYRVGRVPKYLAVSPDGRYLLVNHWCSWDTSVIDLKLGREVRRIPNMGPNPRGIAFDATSRYAYVAVMWTRDLVRIDLRTWKTLRIRNVGYHPRHLVMDPAGRYLYASLDGDKRVAKIDLRTNRVVARVVTGVHPRTLAIAPDGRSLYVVNYESDTLSKIDARSMRVIQVVKTYRHPVGLTYDEATRSVWVACYSGRIMVFRDR